MNKLLGIMILSLMLSGNVYGLSIDRERSEYEQCLQILINAGKKKARSRFYCVCSVRETSKKYSDAELDKIVSKGPEYVNKKTKSIAKKCAKEANAK